MIKNELKIKRNGNVIDGQLCIIECDVCKNEYDLVYRYVRLGREKYIHDLCRSCKQKLQYSIGSREKQREKIIERNKFAKGKSLEELYGEEKAKALRESYSKRSSGSNNPNYGGAYSKWEGAAKWREKNKGKSLEELYGEEKAKALRESYSKRSSGSNNPMFGKPAPTGSGNGWSGWFRGIYFRSLLELSYIKYLIDSQIEFENAECVKHGIRYEIDSKERTYFPDFFIKKSKEYIEVKPSNLINTVENTLKFSAAKKVFGSNFKIITEKDISKITLEEIHDLRKSGDLKFLDRYEQKFQERYYGKD